MGGKESLSAHAPDFPRNLGKYRTVPTLLLAIFESTASVLPSALSESTSCVRTGYKEDTKRISDVAFNEFGRVC